MVSGTDDYIQTCQITKLLNDYYRLRGWTDNGIPMKEKLQELGLDFIVEDLYAEVPKDK